MGTPLDLARAMGLKDYAILSRRIPSPARAYVLAT